MRWLPRVANAYRPGTERLGLPVSRAFRLPDVAPTLLERIAGETAGGQPSLATARDTIRATWPTMRRMIETLP
jgi:hypothetical protein